MDSFGLISTGTSYLIRDSDSGKSWWVEIIFFVDSKELLAGFWGYIGFEVGTVKWFVWLNLFIIFFKRVVFVFIAISLSYLLETNPFFISSLLLA